MGAAWVPMERFRLEVVPILRASGWGRFEYRLHLADLVFQELGLDPLEPILGMTLRRAARDGRRHGAERMV